MWHLRGLVLMLWLVDLLAFLPRYLPVRQAPSSSSPPHATGGQATSGDPQHEQKLELLALAGPFIEQISSRLVDLVDEDEKISSLQSVLELCLISDLTDDALDESRGGISSMKEKRSAFFASLANQRRFLVTPREQVSAAVDYIASLDASTESNSKVAIIVGDCGRSLIGDLLLAHALVALDLASSVTFLAATGQSSSSGSLRATTLDVAGHISHLSDPRLHNDAWAVRHFGEALRLHLAEGRFDFLEDDYWIDSSPYCVGMPSGVQDRLKQFKLVICKGEANYLRLANGANSATSEGGADLSTLSTALSCLPAAAVIVLRAVKSELLLGVSDAVTKRLEREDISWARKGKHSVVHFHEAFRR